MSMIADIIVVLVGVALPVSGVLLARELRVLRRRTVPLPAPASAVAKLTAAHSEVLASLARIDRHVRAAEIDRVARYERHLGTAETAVEVLSMELAVRAEPHPIVSLIARNGPVSRQALVHWFPSYEGTDDPELTRDLNRLIKQGAIEPSPGSDGLIVYQLDDPGRG